jgi:hypothetical protein
MNDNINSRIEATSFASIRNICRTIIKFKMIARTVKECMTIANFFVKRKKLGSSSCPGWEEREN